MNAIDISGHRFGLLRVVGQAQARNGRRAWRCVCDCGNTTEALGANLRSGHTTSCGCVARSALKLSLKHGGHGTAEYKVWRGMKNRCENPNEPAYPDYGGRSIKICARWQSFENFLSDMGARPRGMTIERIDVNGDYAPGNCRWATMREQQGNRRDTIRVCIDGRTQALKHWCEELGRAYKTVHLRLTRYGYELNRALDLPAGTAALV
jgi:hypothetical protein